MPDQKSCHYCHKRLEPNTLGQFSGPVPRLVLQELTPKVGWFCPSCNVIACSTCSHRAAAAAGKGYFVCPTCGANISENYAK